ncbi:MAG: enoyl-CoA hydratase/isomerase family protein [Nitrospira sp.]|nr:enoyl-CoA hydratase/isomerase family protein [Nitrospira sp.]
MASVRTETSSGGTLLRLIVDKPKGNIFTADVMSDLRLAVGEAASETELKLITLEAAGKHFSFGASVEEHTRERVAEMLSGLTSLVMTICESEVPVASLVQGMCLGGAFEVVLASHFIFAAEDARMGVPEIRLGVFPPAAAALLPKKASQALADRMIISGEELTGAELHTIGLVHRTYPADSLRAGVDEWFDSTLGKFSASSIRHATRNARAHFTRRLEMRLKEHNQDYIEKLMATKDANEGIQAFIERREPKWSNQ